MDYILQPLEYVQVEAGMDHTSCTCTTFATIANARESSDGAAHQLQGRTCCHVKFLREIQSEV